MTQPRVIDYEGSRYSTEFWNPAREYEDRAERIALRAMLPPRGQRLVEIGAGAGRLAELYLGYDEIVLMDYALDAAPKRARLGARPRFKFIAADVYRLPFADAAFDTLVMVRVMHHLADVPSAGSDRRDLTRRWDIRRRVCQQAQPQGECCVTLSAASRGRPIPARRSNSVELNFDFHPPGCGAVARGRVRSRAGRSVSSSASA
jgi:hypothetical protein